MRSLVVAAAACALLSGCGCNGVNISTSNNLPEVVIQQPVDGSVHSADEPIVLRGRALDSGAGGGIIEVAWTSDIDGVLYEGLTDDDDGNTRYEWTDPSAGDHDVTLRATDTDGATTRETIAITVVDDVAPLCTITSPTGEVVLDSSVPILLQGQVDDDNTPLDELAVSWSSDVDGVLDESPANEVGVISAEVTVSASNHELTLTVTDGAGLVCTDVVYVITNGAPSTPGIAIEPNPPSIFEDMVGIITSESVDPEGEEVTYGFRWYLNDAPWFFPEDAPGHIIPAADLARDQVWVMEVTPVDPLEVTGIPATLEVIVPDTAPGPPEVAISPAEPTQAADLLCEVTVEAVDPDLGDVVSYAYAWVRDGTPTAHADAVLPWAETSVGEVWTCEVTATDGTLQGEPGSDDVTIEAGCFSFEGQGTAGASHALVLDDPALRLDSGDFTVEAWVRPDEAPGAIVSKRDPGSDNGWHLALDDGGFPFFHVSIGANPLLTADLAVNDGEWHHVALVYDSGSGQATFFLDGQPDASAALPSPSGAAAADLKIGADAASVGDPFEGLIDDVRISSVARYGIPFIPDTSLSADADTLGMWTFEEGTGTVAHDVSLSGHDAFMVAASFSTESTCGLDLPPTTPIIGLTPTHPDDADDLVCDLLGVSVDPEGLPVTYSGEWLLGGVPIGATFASLPATYPGGSSVPSGQYSCRVVASDGLQDSAPATDSVYVDSMPVCVLSVADPASAGSQVCGFEAPFDGLLEFIVHNPDLSADGHFKVDLGTLGTTWLFTGFRDWAYDGATVGPWDELVVQRNVNAALGTISVNLQYDPSSGTDNTGDDEIQVRFVYYDQLDTSLGTEVVSDFVASADASDGAPAASNASATLGPGDRLLLETTACGSAGLGGHGLYASDDGTPGNDGLIRVDTGDPTACALPLQSVTLPSGTWDFSLVIEDDFWADNTGDRGLTVYRYTP